MCVVQVQGSRRIKHSIPVTLPVKRYLEKWYPNEYELSKDDFLGIWLINALVRKTIKPKTFTGNPKELAFLAERKMTETWKFLTPLRYNDSIAMPKRRVFELHNLIMKFMHIELLYDIEARQVKGDPNSIQNSINHFRDRYGISDADLSDDRLRKMYQRFKKDNQGENELTNFLPGMLLGKIYHQKPLYTTA